MGNSVKGIILILLSALCGNCGGSSSSSPPPLPPPPSFSIAVSISPLGTNSSVSGSVTVSATVQNAVDVVGVQFKLNSNDLGTEDTSAPYSISWDTRNSQNGSHRIQAVARRSTGATMSSSDLTVNVDNPIAPTIALSPNQANLVLSGTGVPATIQIALTLTGNPAPSNPTCNSSYGTPTLVPTGPSVTLSVPDADPPSFAVALTCTVSTTAGTAQAQTNIDLEYPRPTITRGPAPFSLESSRAFLGRTLTGSGFYPQGSVSVSPPDSFRGATLVDATELQVHFEFDPFNWSPGWYDIAVSSPTGAPGGGVSDVYKMGFLGNQNTLTCTSSECYHQDQGARVVRRFRLSDGQSRPGFFVGNLTTGIAIDDQTGSIVIAARDGVGTLRETVQFKAFLLPANDPFFMSGPEVTASAVWASSDPTVALPTTTPGEFVGMDAGSANLTATFNGISRSLPFIVVPHDAPTAKINPDVWTFTGPGQSQQFTVDFYPRGRKGIGLAPSQDVTQVASWTSSDLNILSPTTTPGQFVSQGPGRVALRATHSGVTAEAVVIVGPTLAAPDLLLFPPSYFFSDFTIGDGMVLGKQVLGAAARGGRAVIAHQLDGAISLVDLARSPLQAVQVTTGGEPWNVTTTSISGDLVAVVFDRAGLRLTLVKVAGGSILRTATLTNIASGGSWQLAVFDSGTGASTAAFLSETERVLIFVDLNTGQEFRRVTLSGAPFRIAADNANGAVIVASADGVTGSTRFTRIAVTTGAITPLTSTTSLLAVGLAVSSDGTKLYCAMRDQLQIIANN